MVDMAINDLYGKVKVIQFGTNQFLIIYTTSYRLPIVTFTLGRTV